MPNMTAISVDELRMDENIAEQVTKSYVEDDLDVETRVERGVLWLDEHVPGWYHRIDLDVFDIRSCNRCVCGQVFEDEAYASRRDNPEYPSCNGYDYFTNHYDHAPVEFGFEARYQGRTGEEIGSEYSELQAAWARLIHKRQG